MNVIKALKNCARPKRSIKRAKKTNKNKSKHVVYVTWKNDKHEIGTLIKGRYYVESELETENGWVGWDIAKKQPCILRIRNGCAVFNAEKSIDTLCESQISNLKENGNKEQCEENPTDINNGKTVKREENEMEMDTFVDSPKPIANANVPDDSDSLNLEPATGPLEIKENISNSFNWDITEGGKNISPISHSPADSVPKMEVTPFGSSELNEPELNKSELWYVTKGELNITPISANETTNEAIRDSMIPNIENSATHDIPLFVPCLLPNCPDKTIFAGCKGEIESETATTTEDPNNPRRKKYVLLNPNATPRYEVTDSVRDNTRSVIISDVPSWYAINIGKFATIQIGDYLEKRYFVLRNITFTHLSSVWLCWDTEDVLYVVLKLSETTVISVLLIESEVHTIAALRDYDPTNSRRENVINIYNNFQLRLSKTAQPCIVLEAMEYNLSLYTSCWTKYILPLDLVKEITRQILEGLDYIHHTGIVHADMKPDNILVTDCKLNNSEHCPEGKTNCTKMHVKIADFANSCAGMLTGTIQTRAYRCIESILGCDCKKPADIWSVACIVFEMTVGDYLFDATNDDGLTPEQEHLIRIIELLGTIPHRIIFRGKHSRKFFDPYGKLKTGPELHPRGLVELLLLYNCLTRENADKLTAFLKPMLEYEPRKRSTAAGCLNHPWLQFE